MPANSRARRLLKRLLVPLLSERTYSYIQSVAMAWDIKNGGWPNEKEIDLVPMAVRPGDTALDIGANYGYYSYHLSRIVGSAGRVYAFEPVPFIARTLRLVSRLLRLRNVEIVPKGCSDHAGPVTFRVPLSSEGSIAGGTAHLAARSNDHAGKETHVRWDNWREVSSEVVTIDDYVPSSTPEISFIKCDIEGAELLAFRGAEKTIERHRPTVLCEINPFFLEGFGFRLDDLLRFFADRGYEFLEYDAGQKRLKAAVKEEVHEANYLFVHSSRRDRLGAVLPLAR